MKKTKLDELLEKNNPVLDAIKKLQSTDAFKAIVSAGEIMDLVCSPLDIQQNKSECQQKTPRNEIEKLIASVFELMKVQGVYREFIATDILPKENVEKIMNAMIASGVNATESETYALIGAYKTNFNEIKHSIIKIVVDAIARREGVASIKFVRQVKVKSKRHPLYEDTVNMIGEIICDKSGGSEYSIINEVKKRFNSMNKKPPSDNSIRSWYREKFNK